MNLLSRDLNEAVIASREELLAAHFENMYRQHSDPWRVGTSWYEQRKISLIMAFLPDEQFDTAMDLGCGNGILTARLAQRSKKITAVDQSLSAAAYTRDRLTGHPDAIVLSKDSVTLCGEVSYEKSQDIITVSEFGYYLSESALNQLALNCHQALKSGGSLIACHWLGRFDDRVQTSDTVHAAFGAISGLRRTASYRDDFVMIDMWQRCDVPDINLKANK